MIVLQMRFNDGKEEFITVDSTEFDPNTGRLILRIGNATMLVANDGFAYLHLNGQLVKEYTVVGHKPDTAEKKAE